MRTSKVLAMVATAALASAALGQGRYNSQPGTVSYVQGQAAINGQELGPRAVGTTTLGVGQMLATGTGKAEMVLARGVILRMDDDSVVKMVAERDGRSEVELDRGRAEVEVAGFIREKDVQVDTANGVQTVLLERGAYEFDGQLGSLRVFDGKAAVSQSASAKKWIDVKGGHELALNGTATKTSEFDRKASADDLYDWESIHPAYTGRAGRGYAAGYPGSGDGEYAYGYGPYGFYPGYGYYGFPYGYGFYPGFGVGIGFGGFYGGGFRGGFRR